MKYFINMRNVVSLIVLMALVTSCCNCVLPTPPKKQDTTEVVQKNTFQVKFSASPNSFSGYGGYGKVHGVLQELSPSGELLHETPLKDSEFTLHFERYPTGIGPCEYGLNKFFVQEGINAETFKVEAEVISGKCKGCKQTIPIMRGGERFSFKAEPNTFTSKGGSGKVLGTVYITDFDGNVIEERDLGDPNFGLNVIDSPEGITIDYINKTFSIAEGGSATFKLQAVTVDSKPHILEIKRED